METLVRSSKGHGRWILFKQKKNTEYEWFPKAEHIKWILPFYLENIQQEMFMDERWNITNLHMKQRRKQMLKLIPHGSHKSELHLLLIPCQTVQWSAKRFFHTIPLLLSYRLLYKWFTFKINKLKCGNIDPQKKGSVLTAQELKFEYGREKQQSAPKNKEQQYVWPLWKIHCYAVELKIGNLRSRSYFFCCCRHLCFI